MALFSLSSQQASWGGLRGSQSLRTSLLLTVSIILGQLLGCRLPRERMENDAFSVSSRTQATVGGCTEQLSPQQCHPQALEEGTGVGKGLKETRVTFCPSLDSQVLQKWLCWAWEPGWARRAGLQGQGASVAFWGEEVQASPGLCWTGPSPSTLSPFLNLPQSQPCAQGHTLGGVLCNIGLSGVCTCVHACMFAFVYKHGESLTPSSRPLSEHCPGCHLLTLSGVVEGEPGPVGTG